MRLALLVTVLLGWLLASVAAQSDSDWRVVVHDFNNQTLYEITPENVTQIQLPIAVRSAAASVDGRYLAAISDTYEVVVADLEADSCCFSFIAPFAQPMEFGVGAVSPDGTQVALYVVREFSQEQPFYGEIFIVEVASGTILAQQSVEDVTETGIYPLFGYWTAEGIELAGSCFACDGIVEGRYRLWDPQVGEVRESNGGLIMTGDYLDLTGEQVFAVRDERFPLEMEMMFGPFNTIYYADATDNPAQMVYVEPGNTNLGFPRWVADGRAVLLSEFQSQESTLIFRDGSSQVIPYASETNVVAATPNGWVTFSPPTGAVFAYEVTNAQQVAVTPLGEVLNVSFLSVVYHPPQGASAPTGFLAASVDIPEALICDGFLPLRLTVNQPGRVTPGAANNLRAEPTTQSELVGQIPGGETFFVLGGPVCTPGMAWWQVEYNGMIGWTGEGQGNTYWTEPVN